jgi:GntR family transcriptional regulator, transcriptional repressor for pyruvate dehydrogenase complex
VTVAAVPPPAVLPQAVLRPARGRNAFEATVEQLATSVRLGVFAPGDRLPPERELAQTLGVSRSTLRDAIAALRAAGMVLTRQGRGGGSVVIYRAPPPGAPPAAPDPGGPDVGGRAGAPDPVRAPGLDGGQMRDALDFRRIVEPGAAALAATRELTAAQRSWLVARRVEVEQAAEAGAHRQADSRLHLALATVTGSALLISSITQVQAVLHEMLTAIPVLAPNIAHSTAQHRAVVDAVLAADPAGARESMEDHCDATAALLRGLLG